MARKSFMKNKKAFLIRVLGKNGVYLALPLLEIGHEVNGTSRDHEVSSCFSFK
jgi:GDP-D-mannose dehydratase